VIGPLPRCGLIFFGSDFSPYFGFPIQDIYSVESLFVGSSSTEDYNLLVLSIIVHGAVGAVRRPVTCGGYFFPFFIECVISPNIVHIIGV
jgi:hypothetical protein